MRGSRTSRQMPEIRLKTSEDEPTAQAVGNVRVGLAGWSNPPAAKQSRGRSQSHLEYYAEHFSCVEINSSFYRTHRRSTYLSWRLATPRKFRFAVKMPRSITHE